MGMPQYRSRECRPGAPNLGAGGDKRPGRALGLPPWQNPLPDSTPFPWSPPMDLGTFSVSLAVKDLAASKAFYAHLGFEPIGGEESQKWLILGNGTTVIGLFEGMFEKNLLTFNPGWTGPFQNAESFTDIRELHERVRAAGIEVLQGTAGDGGAGPASFVIQDPDGNPILLDQHR
jgi:lactoylglutathione lyase